MNDNSDIIKNNSAKQTKENEMKTKLDAINDEEAKNDAELHK